MTGLIKFKWTEYAHKPITLILLAPLANAVGAYNRFTTIYAAQLNVLFNNVVSLLCGNICVNMLLAE